VTKPRPVVMFHGYSAGGTTFSHHAVNPSFARYLYDLGYDVWVADLRTSSGHPASAKMGWSFDQVGAEDVPAIIDKVLTLTGKAQVDVVAHCMGAIVFGMAALGPGGKLDGKVNRAAFTQVAPLVVFSPANVIRAYVLRYLVEFLPEDYSFNPKEPTLADDLLDRVLATLPYPIEEFDLENPPGFFHRKERTPWTRTRHRMDALYGRDFSLVHMDPNLLRFIDEHFASVHLRTVTQALHFVRWSMMTDHRGRNAFISRATLGPPRWNFPTFSVHGTDNGLSHVATMDRMAKILKDAGRTYKTPFYNEGAGHQDALIGNTRIATFEKVEEFLTDNLAASTGPPDTEMTAYPPWLGPVITEERPNTPLLVIRVGSMPSHREVQAALMLRVVVSGDQVLRPDLQPWDAAYISDHAAAYTSPALRDQGWDAFEVPAPTSFPGYSPGDPIGNGVLVLLTYAEDRSLPALLAVRHFYAQQGAVWAYDVRRQQDPVRIGGQAEFERFQKMVAAASKAIELSLALRPGLNLDEPQLKLIQPASTAGAISGVGATTTLTVPMTTASLTFGVSTATGVAAFKELTEDDRHLMDGVIPYDPPAASLPTPSAGGTSFVLASCQYPAGLIDERVAYRGYERITARLDAGTGIVPRFLVLAGDQVYVDPTAGLYDPSSTEDRYRRPYDDWLSDPCVRNALRRIPSFMLLDDHEIGDNWEPPDDGQLATDGVAAYKKYQRGLHPALNEFSFDGFRFFLLNTRTDRTARKVGAAAGTLFGAAEMAALKSWLLNEPGPKFVVTSSMLLPRHRRAIQNDARLVPDNVSALHSDGWDGFPATLSEVLDYIAQNGISHVVFLSGDEHRGCIASIELRNSIGMVLARAHSVHTAAMYAPFPFANSLDEDIVPSESFDVTFGSTTYTCVVNAMRPPAGDGPTFLRMHQQFGTWRLDCEYADGAVQTLTL
jgi:alpha-beta hydrolase superfamily lysophospholipase